MSWRRKTRTQRAIIRDNLVRGISFCLYIIGLILRQVLEALLGFIASITVIVFAPIWIPLQIILVICNRCGFFYIRKSSRPGPEEDDRTFRQILTEPFRLRDSSDRPDRTDD
ncbi:hypothetical protein KKF05_02910 [Patescibacteria group bacterium]|nr:hypothetical protein [Patescibacteria group bacterium]MBU1029070.1 hypothetical protein [Patescibacteria group bacterium]MBU1915690.1 hypothetical protein [Patescibacteria group bacterium]